jgi:hypothetical protein
MNRRFRWSAYSGWRRRGDGAAIERRREEIASIRARREQEAKAAALVAKSRGERWWTLLNSPLTLFLLSSVVLTGVSQLYARSQAEATERAERRASFFRLFTELEYRIARLEIDDDLLSDLGPGAESEMRRIGDHAQKIVTGAAADGQSAPEYRNVYLGAIVNQVELAAGLPANRELAPEVEDLIIDPCETAVVLHEELNVFRRWIELRHPLVDSGKLPKIPTHVLSDADQASLVMPDFDMLRGADGATAHQRHAVLEKMRPGCEDAVPED